MPKEQDAKPGSLLLRYARQVRRLPRSLWGYRREAVERLVEDVLAQAENDHRQVMERLQELLQREAAMREQARQLSVQVRRTVDDNERLARQVQRTQAQLPLLEEGARREGERTRNRYRDRFQSLEQNHVRVAARLRQVRQELDRFHQALRATAGEQASRLAPGTASALSQVLAGAPTGHLEAQWLAEGVARIPLPGPGMPVEQTDGARRGDLVALVVRDVPFEVAAYELREPGGSTVFFLAAGDVEDVRDGRLVVRPAFQPLPEDTLMSLVTAAVAAPAAEMCVPRLSSPGPSASAPIPLGEPRMPVVAAPVEARDAVTDTPPSAASRAEEPDEFLPGEEVPPRVSGASASLPAGLRPDPPPVPLVEGLAGDEEELWLEEDEGSILGLSNAPERLPGMAGPETPVTSPAPAPGALTKPPLPRLREEPVTSTSASPADQNAGSDLAGVPVASDPAPPTSLAEVVEARAGVGQDDSPDRPAGNTKVGPRPGGTPRSLPGLPGYVPPSGDLTTAGEEDDGWTEEALRPPVADQEEVGGDRGAVAPSPKPAPVGRENPATPTGGEAPPDLTDVVAFLLGKVVGRDIVAGDGTLLAARGTPIDAALVTRCEEHGRLPELIVFMELPG